MPVAYFLPAGFARHLLEALEDARSLTCVDILLRYRITNWYFPNPFVDADTGSQCGTPYGHRAADMYMNADGRKAAAKLGINIRVGMSYDVFLAEVEKALQVKTELPVKRGLQVKREFQVKR